MQALRKSQNTRRQRGAAAVEFALVLPLFVVLMGLMYSVGIGIWARYMLINYANAAARFCAWQVPANTSTMLGCATTYIANATAPSPTNPSPLCQAPPTTAVSIQPGPVNNAAMSYLRVEVRCPISWAPMVNAGSSASFGPTYDITAFGEMPYLAPQQP